MDFFADNNTVAQVEADVKSASNTEKQTVLNLTAELAWHLRQRNTQRALLLADQALALIASLSKWGQAYDQKIPLRLMLIQAEAKWLFGELEASKTLAETALQGFAMRQDRLGCADAHWLLALLAYDAGDGVRHNAALTDMAAAASGIDPIRVIVAQSTLATSIAFRDTHAARAYCATQVDIPGMGMNTNRQENLHPAAACGIENMHGVIVALESDYVQGIRHMSKTYSLALTCGHLRRAIVATGNIGDSFNNLNEYHASLEWMERGLELARQSGWPSMIGLSLVQTAETLRRLQRFEAAANMLREALALMAHIPASRYYAIALEYLGDIELDRGQDAHALNTFRLLEHRAMALGQHDMHASALRGQAQALLRLGDPQQALLAAEAALAERKTEAHDQINALRIMAEIHASQDKHPFPLPIPSNMTAPSTTLHYLQQALDLAATVTDYNIPGDLLETTADAYAKAGDTHHAYLLAKQAISARKKTHTQEALNRAHAVQVIHQAERSAIEHTYLRELASKAKHAEILQQNNATLEHLGSIGQEITAHLALDQVCEVINRHVHHLLDVNIFGIGLLNPGTMEIHSIFLVEDGKPMAPMRIPLSGSRLAMRQYITERREILIDLDPESPDPTWPKNLTRTASRLFAPLCLADKLLGGMTIQSRRRHAYGVREQIIFRTLCAYAAIAISNADAHGKLAAAHRLQQETQQQMLLQGKMAGLGTLTAGVAHEINNPTNFAHVAAQNLRVDLRAFETWLNALINAEEASELIPIFAQHFKNLHEHIAIMLNGTERIRGIVQDLRAFTRLDQAEKKAVRLSECLLSTLNLVRTSWQEKVEFITEFSDDPVLDCWPALLNQVFMNLLVNGCQAIEEKQQSHAAGTEIERGKLWLRLTEQAQDNTVTIAFQDSGTGIDAASQERIMEPFYTTKPVGVGTGLGLSIAFGIVQKHGGDLYFNSTLGAGSCFIIRLPRQLASIPGATAS
jgi:signal transduction histidine kinase